MDPNTALERIRGLVEIAINEDGDIAAWTTLEIAELITGLDTWIAMGGALPDAWKRKDASR